MVNHADSIYLEYDVMKMALFFKISLLIDVFFSVLGLRCCPGFSLVAVNRDCSLVVVSGLLIAVASLVAEHRL